MMSSRGARLLIVDDSRSMRAALRRFFEGHGFEVEVASGGAEALSRLEQRGSSTRPTATRDASGGAEALSRLEGSRFDLVLLDVIMPGLDGLEVLERIRESHDKLELPVLMATARSDSSDVVRALELGANDYVTKPIDMPIALARIESHLSITRQASTAALTRAYLKADGSVPLGTVLDGRYELQEVLGEGGFAVVYKTRQVSTGQTVAIKLLRAHLAATPGSADVELARFRREMSLIGQLRHPHIIRLIDSGWLEVRSASEPLGVRPFARLASAGGEVPTAVTQTIRREAPPRGRRSTETVSRAESSTAERCAGDLETRIPFIVMEYLEGESLYQLLAREKTLGAVHVAGLMLPVMSALWSAHSEGVVHRDLKPGNIFLARAHGENVRPIVLDFGVARLTGESAPALTVTHSMVGTPGYWSPEQARGTRNVDARSDQYTLGTIIYRCVTGESPFSGSGMQLVHQIARGEFPPPQDRVEGLPPGFQEVVLRAMANDPQDRFPSLRAMARALLPFSSENEEARWSPSFAPGATAPPPPD